MTLANWTIVFAHNGLFIDKRFQDGFDDAKYLPNGKILVLGKINNEFALLQLNPDGQIDLTYGNRGLALSNFPTVAVPSRLAIDANGRAVVVGSIVTATGGDFAVARFDRTGNLDGQFSGDGMLTIDLTGLSEDGIDIATDPNGRIWLSGSVDGANSKFGVVRVNSSGVLDIGFDGDGIGTYDANPGSSISETFRSMQLFPDGTLAIAGEADTSFRIVRINANGSLRSGFGTNGVVNTNIGPDAALGELALDSEGRLIAAGRVGLNHLSRVVLVGYDPSTGATNTGFGDANGQKLLNLFGVESVSNRVRINGANSKLTIAASSSQPDNLIVARLEPGAPVLVVASQANYRENQAAVNLSPFASVSDSDSIVLGGGVLTVQNTNSKPSRCNLNQSQCNRDSQWRSGAREQYHGWLNHHSSRQLASDSLEPECDIDTRKECTASHRLQKSFRHTPSWQTTNSVVDDRWNRWRKAKSSKQLSQ